MGDTVLLKNTKETGKLAPNFEPKPYVVVDKEGSEVRVERDGVEYRRNSSFVKPVVQNRKERIEHEDNETNTSNENVQNSNNDKAEKSTPIIVRRSSRTTRTPAKYKDFVVNKT